MSEPKFTPGPWQSKRAFSRTDGEYDYCVNAVISGRAQVIAEAFGRTSETDRPCAEANARLMAAAPELYEEGALSSAALRLAASFLRDHGQSLIASIAETQAVKQDAAIAKARGEP